METPISAASRRARLLIRLAAQAPIKAQPWTRDELYKQALLNSAK